MEIIQVNQGIKDTDRTISKISEMYLTALEEENSHAPMGELRTVNKNQKKDIESFFFKLLSPELENQACLFISQNSSKEIVGYFLGMIKECLAETPDRIGYINGLYVTSDHRKASLGRQLLAHGLEWFKNRNISLVELYTSFNNSAARAFWAKQGFLQNEIVLMKKLEQ